MRILIIDNYDSFTFNLAQLFASATGCDPLVIRNDAVSPTELKEIAFDAAVLSPGPGRPDRASDFGLCSAIINDFRMPVLGVCLGHQGIGQLFGAKVVHAPEPMHGRISKINHNGLGLFRGLRSPFKVVRYHSLIVTELPEHLEIDATTEDGLVMGLHHRHRPLWGVQFHPESFASEFGEQIIANFLELVEKHHSDGKDPRAVRSTQLPPVGRRKKALKSLFQELDIQISAASCFESLFRESHNAVWLDSSSHANAQGRYSFMGDGSGPHSELIDYDVNSGFAEARSRGSVERVKTDIFDFVENRLTEIEFVDNLEMPVPFKGGYVGYWGYELKAHCGGDRAHESDMPDATLIFLDRFIAFDHQEGRIWMVCLVEPGDEQAARNFFVDVMERLRNDNARLRSATTVDLGSNDQSDRWEMRHSRTDYLAKINLSLAAIRDGESYEICLCNEWRQEFSADPLTVYNTLRTINPAPYAAFLRFGEVGILSCSPERMVCISKDRLVSCKPIKGTIRRGASRVEDEALKLELATSEKDRAENLMIVDLIRNDLNRVCRTGSVRVPVLCAIETFASVHQMVSTVEGELRNGKSTMSCLRSLFPGGSMTGAPKIRTMAIIDQLEEGPRGVYSGAIGYISLDGAVDLNIVIRTVVVKDGKAAIGAGGAIVSLSDPESELEETMLKSRLLRKTIEAFNPCPASDLQTLRAGNVGHG